ncbi:hypothetical protein DB818_24175, partial [Xanthomonas perforans]|uniref:hypothetical protein n=2 Tax=Xanthomonas perforans TaxID=442694 RepID=UPI0011685E75
PCSWPNWSHRKAKQHDKDDRAAAMRARGRRLVQQASPGHCDAERAVRACMGMARDVRLALSTAVHVLEHAGAR